LRGFRERRLKSLGTFASLAGTILVRSYEQSDRVYKAMILRGYGQSAQDYNYRDEFQAYPRNLAGLMALLLAAVALVIVDVCLR